MIFNNVEAVRKDLELILLGLIVKYFKMLIAKDFYYDFTISINKHERLKAKLNSLELFVFSIDIALNRGKKEPIRKLLNVYAFVDVSNNNIVIQNFDIENLVNLMEFMYNTRDV